MTKYKTRFAPSPTGYLHIGHALSAYTAWAWAKQNNADFILRIEDIDTDRCKDVYAQSILNDLQWLGIDWVDEVLYQSNRFEIYQDALAYLQKKHLIYPCFATRKDIESHSNTNVGADGTIYPKIWRGASSKSYREQMNKKTPYCQRLKTDTAYSYMIDTTFTDMNKGTVSVNPNICGDVIVQRKDTPTSYHLSVCVDDYLQGITHVIRGVDLFKQTHIHRILQDALSYNQPMYMHHDLITDSNGKKFSKTDKSLTIRSLRQQGYSPADVFKMIGIDINNKS